MFSIDSSHFARFSLKYNRFKRVKHTLEISGDGCFVKISLVNFLFLSVFLFVVSSKFLDFISLKEYIICFAVFRGIILMYCAKHENLRY